MIAIMHYFYHSYYIIPNLLTYIYYIDKRTSFYLFLMKNALFFSFFKKHQMIKLMLVLVMFMLLIKRSVSDQLVYSQVFEQNSTELFSFVQITNNDLITNASLNSTKSFKISVQLYLKSQNGSIMTDAIGTANTVVKLWKNLDYVQKNEILSQNYESLTKTKQFSQNMDKNDNGQVDLQALYQLKSKHQFLINFQNSSENLTKNQTLFVLGIYRFSEQNLPILGDIFPNRNWSLTQIENSGQSLVFEVSVYMSSAQTQYQCTFCNNSILAYCPLKKCRCFEDVYNNCQLQRFQIEQLNTTQNNVLTTQSQHFDYYHNNLKNAFSIVISLSTNLQISIVILLKTQADINPLSQATLYNYDQIYSYSKEEFTKIGTSSTSTSRLLTIQSNSSLKSLTATIPPQSNLYISVFSYQSQNLSFPFTRSIQIQPVIYNNFLSGPTVDFFLIMIVIFCVLFVILIVVCVCRYYLLHYSYQNSNQRRVLNQDYQNLKNIDFPSVYYQFLKLFIFSNKRFKINQQNNKSQQHQHQKNYQINVDELSENQNIPQNCSICLQQFYQNSIVKYTYCGHVLHTKCIKQWFNKQFSCPLCRQVFSFQEIAQYQKKLKLKVLNSKNPLIKSLYQLQNINIQTKCIKKMLEKKEIKSIKQQNLDAQVSLTEQHFQNSIKNKIQPRIILNDFKKNQQNCLEMIEADSFTDLNQRKSDKKKEQSFSQLQNLNDSTEQQIQRINLQKLSKVYKFYKIIYLYHELNKRTPSCQSFIFEMKSSNKSHKKYNSGRMFGVVSRATESRIEDKQKKDAHIQQLIENLQNRQNSKGQKVQNQLANQNQPSSKRIKSQKPKGFSMDLNQLQLQLNLKSNPKLLQQNNTAKNQQYQFQYESKESQNQQHKTETKTDILLIKPEKKTLQKKQKNQRQILWEQFVSQPINKFYQIKIQEQKQKQMKKQKILKNQNQEPNETIEPIMLFSLYSYSNEQEVFSCKGKQKNQGLVYENQIDNETRSIQESKAIDYNQIQSPVAKYKKMSAPAFKHPESKIKQQQYKNVLTSKKSFKKRVRQDQSFSIKEQDKIFVNFKLDFKQQSQ